ncbi:MAG: LLM class flavin-dependent oxidoreductase, partial [Acidimicrobiales bacterium]
MKFGIAFANTMGFAEAEGAAVLARGAEAAGFDSVWTVEHVIVPKDYKSTYPYDPSGKMPGGPEASIPDPLIWLTWVAANSTTLRLATGILILPERNPLVLAKAVATLDNLSGGRVDLGIGVGWLEEEFDALGIPWA